MPEAFRNFLQSQRVMHLATFHNASCYTTPLYYVILENNQLLFASAFSSYHMQSLLENGSCAISIANDVTRFENIQGMQILAQFSNAVTIHAMQCYYETLGVQELGDSALFAVSINWIKMTDNTKGFGHKEVVTF